MPGHVSLARPLTTYELCRPPLQRCRYSFVRPARRRRSGHARSLFVSDSIGSRHDHAVPAPLLHRTALCPPLSLQHFANRDSRVLTFSRLNEYWGISPPENYHHAREVKHIQDGPQKRPPPAIDNVHRKLDEVGFVVLETCTHKLLYVPLFCAPTCVSTSIIVIMKWLLSFKRLAI